MGDLGTRLKRDRLSMALYFPERSWFGNFEIILTPTILFQVLELFPGSRITFKMFSVTTALCERVTVLEWVHFVRWYMQYLENCSLTVFTYTKLFMLRGGVANVRLFFNSTRPRVVELKTFAGSRRRHYAILSRDRHWSTLRSSLRDRSEHARVVRHISLMLCTLFSLFSAFVKQLVEDLDLFDLECKLGMFRVRLSFHRVSERFLFVLHVRITPREHCTKIFTVRLYKSVFRGEAQPSLRNSIKEHESSYLRKELRYDLV